ncbi:MAG: amidohydrolase [Chloroflexi bacterium]|nr:amidohydrolase [Chloroflexota bacterium]
MYKGYRFIEVDAHMLEPSDMWVKYLEPKFRDEMPVSSTGYYGDPPGFQTKVQIGEYFMPFGTKDLPPAGLPGLKESYGDYIAKGFTPDCYETVLARTGIDYMMMFPTVNLYVTTVLKLSPATAAAYRRAYNNWLYDFIVQIKGRRLLGAGAIDLRDPVEAAREARRCVKELGFKAIMINPEPVGEHRLYDPLYDPLWSELEDLDTALAVHVVSGTASETWTRHYFPAQRLTKGRSACSFTIGNMLASMALIAGGVLERHPKLRVVHLESGAGWTAFWLDRMDASVAGAFRGTLFEGVKKSPVEYFQRQCFISADPDDPGLKPAYETLGTDSLVTATDFGHPEGKGYIHALEDMLKQPIPDDVRHKMMWDNAARLYAIREN